MKNQLIAKLFYEIADMLEMQDVEWKPRAYRKAAQSIEALSEPIEEIYKKGGIKAIEEIPGVGERIAEKIIEVIKTGKLRAYERLKKKIPVEVEELMNIPSLGPKKIKALYKRLKIKNIKDLKRAALQNKIAKLPGMGEKTQALILEGVKEQEVSKKRFLLGLMLPKIKEIESELKKLKQVQLINIAGSVRRMKETIHDVDILIATSKPKIVVDYFTKMDDVARVLAKGPTKSTVKLKNNLQVDIRVIDKNVYGSALQYLTGSKQHSIKLRQIAIRKGYKLSEYGLFKGKKIVAGKTEKELYNKLGLPYIEAELREDTGEIEAAIKRKLPKLIDYNDVYGDLHAHTKWSDGNNSILEMANAAKKLGYQYLAICDHSAGLKIAYGMDESRVLKQIKEIDKLNGKFKNFKILKGIECNITPGGELDIKKNVLKKLDLVSAGIHSRFKLGEKEMTDRIVKAIESGLMNILVHPTGRLLQRRKPYAVDLERIYDIAKKNNVYLEINASPDRLDLNDVNARGAIKKGLKLAVGTDSHSVDQLNFLKLGIAVARRSWCSKKDILNSLSLKQLEKRFLK